MSQPGTAVGDEQHVLRCGEGRIPKHYRVGHGSVLYWPLFMKLPVQGCDTLNHGCLKVHGGVRIVLCIFVDPL